MDKAKLIKKVERAELRYTSSELPEYKKAKLKRKAIKAFQEACDWLWRQIVYKRANYKCEICGEDSTINAHHIITRKAYIIRWDIENGVCLCFLHHKYGIVSAHDGGEIFIRWLDKNYPKRADSLRKKLSQKKTWDIKAYKQLFKNLRKILNT